MTLRRQDCMHQQQKLSFPSCMETRWKIWRCHPETGHIWVLLSGNLLDWRSANILSFFAPGEVRTKLLCDSDVKEMDLRKDATGIPKDDQRAIIQPAGLSQERKLDLFSEIRQFVTQGPQHRLCPKPPPASSSGPTPTQATPASKKGPGQP